MFERDIIQERGRALEDEFFRRVDQQLRDQLRASMEREKSIQKLGDVTGFEDPAVLEHLVDGGFQAASLAALALVPVVFVAWADEEVSEEERKTVMSAALGRGMSEQPVALRLIEDWLDKRPPDSLWDLWQEYTAAVYSTMDASVAEVLSREIMRQSTRVAEASGGTLGFRKISKVEQAVLDKIAAVGAS